MSNEHPFSIRPLKRRNQASRSVGMFNVSLMYVTNPNPGFYYLCIYPHGTKLGKSIDIEITYEEAIYLMGLDNLDQEFDKKLSLL